jgi:predicted PurR-regulated permease PerM
MAPETNPAPTSEARTRILSASFLAAFALLLLVGVYMILRPFAEILLAAAMLAVSFFPLYAWIHSKVRNSNLAALACILFLLFIILAPLTLLGTVVASEAATAYGGLQRESQQQGGWATYLSHAAAAPADWISSRTGIPASEIKAVVAKRGQVVAERLVTWTGRLFGNLTSTLADILLILFVTFFFFPIGERFGSRLHEYVPVTRDRLDLILSTLKSAIVANLYGMVAVAASQGALVGIGFALTGLSSPAFWGVVAAFASLIPFIGTALIVGPAVLVLLIAGSYGKAAFLLAWGIVVVGMSDNFVRPMVLKKGIEMSTLAIFLSLMGGVQAFGFMGLFAGPVILTMAFVMLKILNEERVAWQRPPCPISATAAGTPADSGAESATLEA